MNYHSSLVRPELPHEMLDLIDRYLQLAPAMVPPHSTEDTDINSPTLWHPDLHLNNIFVDPESKKITHVIDWQSAWSLPLFYNSHVSDAIKHNGPALTVLDDLDSWPEPPENYHSLPPEEKRYIDIAISSEVLHKYYLSSTQAKTPRRWVVLQRAAELGLRTAPVAWVQRVWCDNEIFFLRYTLLNIANRWEELCPDAGPCPWVFTKDELAAYEHEKENRGYVSVILSHFKDNWGVPTNGYIEIERFAEVQDEMKKIRAEFVESADDEDEKQLVEKIWPYEDHADV